MFIDNEDSFILPDHCICGSRPWSQEPICANALVAVPAFDVQGVWTLRFLASDGCASKTFQKVPTMQDNPRISAHTPSMFSISVQHFCNIYRTIKNPSGVCAWGSLTMIGRRVNFSKTWNKSGIVQVQVKSLNLTEANCELRQESFFCRRWSW